MLRKPKCYGCGKAGDEIHYVWYKGNLWHYSCLSKVAKLIQKNVKTNIY